MFRSCFTIVFCLLVTACTASQTAPPFADASLTRANGDFTVPGIGPLAVRSDAGPLTGSDPAYGVLAQEDASAGAFSEGKGKNKHFRWCFNPACEEEWTKARYTENRKTKSVSVPDAGATFELAQTTRIGRLAWGASANVVLSQEATSETSAAASTQLKLASVDTIYVLSKTLKPGTRVKLRITVTVNPSVALVPCTTGVDGWASFAGRSYNNHGGPEIIGTCPFPSGAYFEWLTAKYTPGTRDSKVLHETVGQPDVIENGGGVYTYVDERAASARNTTLFGTEKITIAPITHGVYFKSASGYRYE